MSAFGNEHGRRPKNVPSRWRLFHNDIRYHGKRHQWHALLREFYWTILRGHYTETCGLCGSPYRGFIWHAPDPLYLELVGSMGGTFCPRCFNAKAKAAGIWLTWTPMVAARDGVFNSNWWRSPTRDRLMMGFPAPDYKDHGYQGKGVTIEQPPWQVVADALRMVEENNKETNHSPDAINGNIIEATAIRAPNQLTLNWQTPYRTGIRGFECLHAPHDTTKWTTVLVSHELDTYTFTDIDDSQEYDYQVVALGSYATAKGTAKAAP